MQFDSFSDFLVMDGHGIYVWTVYVVALLVLTLLVVTPLRRDRRFFVEQSMLHRRNLGSRGKTANPDEENKGSI